MQAEACNFIKKETPAHVLSCEFYKVFQSIFHVEHLLVTASLTEDCVLVYVYYILLTTECQWKINPNLGDNIVVA